MAACPLTPLQNHQQIEWPESVRKTLMIRKKKTKERIGSNVLRFGEI